MLRRHAPAAVAMPSNSNSSLLFQVVVSGSLAVLRRHALAAAALFPCWLFKCPDDPDIEITSGIVS